MVRLPSREPIQMITPATASAATASSMLEPRDVVFLAQPRAGDAEDDDERAPDVRREMQRVGFERFAGIFFRHAIQGARADEIDSHAKRENEDQPRLGRIVGARKSSR